MRSDFELEVRPICAFPLQALEGDDRGHPSPAAVAAVGASTRAARLPTVRVTRRYRASPERVFAAWLDARTAGRWLFATASHPIAQVDIDPRVGGAFRFVERRRGAATAYSGRYREIVPFRRLVFALTIDDARASTVTVEIVPRRGGCELVVSQHPVPLVERERAEGRWLGILYGLDVMLDVATLSGQTRS